MDGWMDGNRGRKSRCTMKSPNIISSTGCHSNIGLSVGGPISIASIHVSFLAASNATFWIEICYLCIRFCSVYHPHIILYCLHSHSCININDSRLCRITGYTCNRFCCQKSETLIENEQLPLAYLLICVNVA